MKRILSSLILSFLLLTPGWGQDYVAFMRKGDRALMNSDPVTMIAFYREATNAASKAYGEASIEHLRARCRLLWGAFQASDLKLIPFCRTTLEEIRAISAQLPANNALVQGILAYSEGSMAFSDGDVNKANGYARRAYESMRPIKGEDPDIYSTVCLLYGQCEDMAKKYKSALSVFEEGLGSIPAPDTEQRQLLTALFLNNIGVCHSKMRNPAAAKAAYGRARELFDKCFPITNEIYLTFLNNEIASDLRVGNLEQARKKSQKVFQGIQRGKGRSSWIYGFSLYYKAMIQKAEGRKNESIKTLREADRSLFDNGFIDNHMRVAILQELSRMLSSQGYLAESGRVQKEAARINKKLLGETAEVAELEDRNDEATLTQMNGDYRKALLILSDIVQKAEGNPEIIPLNMGKYYGNLAVVLKELGYYQESLAYSRKSLDILRKAPGGETSYRHHVINHIELCRILGLSGEADRFMKEAQRIEDNSMEGLRFQAAMYLQQSDEAVDDGKHDQAFELSRKAIEAYERAESNYTKDYLYALYLGAFWAYEANKSKEITPLAQKFFNTVKQTIRQQFLVMTEAERKSFWEEFDEMFQGMMTLAMTAEDNKEVSSQLFDAALLRKGILTMSSLDMEQLLRRSGDESLLESYTELRRLRGAMLSHPEQTDLAERARAIESALMSKVSSYGEFLDNLTVGWKDVQSRLAPDEIAVEFILSNFFPEASLVAAAVVRRDWKKPEYLLLGWDDKGAIKQVIRERNDTEIRNLLIKNPGEGLYALFWEQLLPFLDGVKHIFFSPDESLHSLPLEYAFMPDGRPMCDHYRMDRLSSTKELLRQPGTKGERCVLFGGLDYDLSPDEMEYYAGMSTRSGSGGSWTYLPGSLMEINQIQGLLISNRIPSRTKIGAEGVEEAFKALDGTRPDIIHVATHGFYREGDQPAMRRCGLVFAGANNSADGIIPDDVDDGLLTGEEVARLDLNGCRLAVLSACDTGLGDAGAEGFSGLAQAFKRAGVDKLILSLWEVGDQSTQVFMTTFYRRLIGGEDIDAAFSSARTELRKRYPSPDVWASFVLLR